jgi:hypothetical protein
MSNIIIIIIITEISKITGLVGLLGYDQHGSVGLVILCAAMVRQMIINHMTLFEVNNVIA